MKNKFYSLLLFLIPFSVDAQYIGKYLTVSSWIQQFDKLPKNREGADSAKHSGFHACGTKEQQWQEFKAVLCNWFKIMAHGSLTIEQHWLASNTQSTKPDSSFFDIDELKPNFQPFAQKLLLQPGEVVYLRGDLHGDIFSLLEQLQDLKEQGVINDQFKIIKSGVWFAFLGDYVDRGHYGCEVMYTMMRLALANPERMIYVRGNHEDSAMHKPYGFKQEVINKFNDIDDCKHKLISRMYDFMPVVCYVGCQDRAGVTHYIQCCHGGIEIGYDPKKLLDSDKQYQLLGMLNRQSMYQKLLSQCSYKDGLQAVYGYMQDDLFLKNPRSHHMLGFMWNDFDVLNEQQVAYNESRGGGFVYGKFATQDILKLQSSAKSKIQGIMRAHQHTSDPASSMMQGLVASKGIYKLWHPYEQQSIRTLRDGLVWTYNVGPDTAYGAGVGFNFDTYAQLTVQQQYKDWRLQVFNI